MKYLYKKTGAVVESGIRLNPAIFQPMTEEKKVISTKKETDEPAEAAAEAAEQNVSPVKTAARTSGTQKKTTVKRTTAAKK